MFEGDNAVVDDDDDDDDDDDNELGDTGAGMIGASVAILLFNDKFGYPKSLIWDTEVFDAEGEVDDDDDDDDGDGDDEDDDEDDDGSLGLALNFS